MHEYPQHPIVRLVDSYGGTTLAHLPGLGCIPPVGSRVAVESTYKKDDGGRAVTEHVVVLRQPTFSQECDDEDDYRLRWYADVQAVACEWSP